MSHIIKLLNDAQKGILGTDPAGACPQKPVPATTTLHWIIGAILCIVLFANLGLTIKLLLIMRNNNSVNAVQISIIAADFEKVKTDLSDLSIRIQDTNARVTSLEKDSEIQATAVENLRRAKDTLFNRLSAVEAKQQENLQSYELIN